MYVVYISCKIFMYLSIFYSWPTANTTDTETTKDHQYPVASNGKLLDVAVIGESAQSTQKPQSDSDVRVLGVTKQTQHKGKARRNDRGLLECPKCSSRHANDPRWVYCPQCFVVIHKTCLLISKCFCKYRLMQ